MLIAYKPHPAGVKSEDRAGRVSLVCQFVSVWQNVLFFSAEKKGVFPKILFFDVTQKKNQSVAGPIQNSCTFKEIGIEQQAIKDFHINYINRRFLLRKLNSNHLLNYFADRHWRIVTGNIFSIKHFRVLVSTALNFEIFQCSKKQWIFFENRVKIPFNNWKILLKKQRY